MDTNLKDVLNGNNLNVNEGTLDTINSDNFKFSGDVENTSLESEPHKESDKFVDGRKNNNHNVVPIGVLIVLVTIYLGMSSVQKCFVNCSENEIDHLKSPKNFPYIEDSKDSQIILERLLEYKDICKDLEVFTKDINNTHDEDDEGDAKQKLLPETEGTSGSGSGSGMVDCAKPYSKKNKKSKYSIKLSTNGKNGFHKHNKSTKAKYSKNDKKDLNLNKKNSTAEPIIYLFALVFIYLLLKAASDINQHYKSENKNDKRFMRRCSLQSYAQTHRTDRRSSKELALKQKPLRTMAPSREQHLLQQQYHHHHLEASFPQRTPTPPTPSSLSIRATTSSNWQLLRQHTMTQSVDNSDITASPSTKPEFSSMMNRRCSVPVALNYQSQTHKNPPISLGMLNRRISITMPLDSLDPLATETKRRVRMINRH